VCQPAVPDHHIEVAYKLKMGAEYDALKADAEIEVGDEKTE
jgi:hypothetical protein